ncbi:unnamed protein product, partial [Meganyctiphanes norvegica]
DEKGGKCKNKGKCKGIIEGGCGGDDCVCCIDTPSTTSTTPLPTTTITNKPSTTSTTPLPTTTITNTPSTTSTTSLPTTTITNTPSTTSTTSLPTTTITSKNIPKLLSTISFTTHHIQQQQ